MQPSIPTDATYGVRMLAEQRMLSFQLIIEPDVVGVVECDPIASRILNAEVPGIRHALAHGKFYDSNS
jgi:hypothetical protein